MKVYWGSGSIAPLILDLGTNGGDLSASRTCRINPPPGKEPRYPLDRKLGGTQNRSGRGGEEKNSHSLPGLEPPIIQPVSQRCTTELPWL
jgi:hypothetical protein